MAVKKPDETPTAQWDTQKGKRREKWQTPALRPLFESQILPYFVLWSRRTQKKNHYETTQLIVGQKYKSTIWTLPFVTPIFSLWREVHGHDVSTDKAAVLILY
mmetsp:Transcript_34308/g.82969  ORF Transcript_34308/g.82969 Transcript_34308/m.82969 type:complete len:103 (-) Transcript_34308:2214-2522(-)